MENTLKSMYRYLNTLFYFALIIVFSAFGSCNSDDTAKGQLARAGRLLDSNPEQALCILDSVNIDSIHNDKMIADYALLLTCARHKNYIDESDESIISLAVDYYTDVNDKENLMKSLYYQSVINGNSQNLKEAMLKAMKAEKLARDLKDDYWIAKTNELITDLLCLNGNHIESMNYNDVVIDYYNRCGKRDNYYYAILDKAITYANINKYDSSLMILKNLIVENRAELNDSTIQGLCMDMAISCLLSLSDYDQAKSYMDSLEKYRAYIPQNIDRIVNFAEISMRLDDLNLSKLYIDSAFQLVENIRDSVLVNMTLANYEYRRGNIETAYSLAYKVIGFQQKEISNKEQVIIGAQRDYYNIENVKNKRHISAMYYIICALCLLLLGVYVISRLMIRVKKLEIQNSINEIHILSNEININKEENAKLKNLSGSVLEERFRMLNKFADDYYYKSAQKSNKTLLTEIEAEIENIKDKESISKLEQLVNAYNDNIITKLREEVPELTEKALVLVTLVYAGLSVRTISLITGSTVHSIYNGNIRIRNRIKESNATHKEWFIEKLKMKKSPRSKFDK